MLDHENITRCLKIFKNQSNDLCMMMEHCDYTLEDRIKRQFEEEGGPMPEFKIWLFFI